MPVCAHMAKTANNKMRVFDTDSHYFEDLDDLGPYFEEPWETRLKEGDDAAKELFFPGSSGERFMYGRISREDSGNRYPHDSMNPNEVTDGMDFLGVDKAIVISHMMLSFPRIVADDDRPEAFATAYMNYVLDNLVDPANGICALIPVPFQHPDRSAELIDRYGNEKGVVGACMITGGAEPPLGATKYEPIYDAGESQGLPFVFHAGGSGLDELYRSGYSSLLETHTLGFLEANIGQLTSLVLQGIPEKFPDLDILFQESGILWIPTIMNRLDGGYLKRQSEAPMLTKLPSEYMKEFYYGTQPFERNTSSEYLEMVIEEIGGADRLMYASDFPHWDFDRPTAITELEFLSDAEKQRILAGTAEEVFGL